MQLGTTCTVEHVHYTELGTPGAAEHVKSVAPWVEVIKTCVGGGFTLPPYPPPVQRLREPVNSVNMQHSNYFVILHISRSVANETHHFHLFSL